MKETIFTHLYQSTRLLGKLLMIGIWHMIGMRGRATNRFRTLFLTWPNLNNKIDPQQLNCTNALALCTRLTTITPTDRLAMSRDLGDWQDPPLISVVIPVYNTEASLLKDAIASIQNQVYPHWELCVADDASPHDHVRPILEEAARADPRIKILYRQENGHISEASNSALSLATGDFIALIDHDDQLTEDALYWVAKEIEQKPDVDLIYSDEDKIREDGQLDAPHFKPDWNEELFLTQNYINHLTVLRRSLVKAVGGFRPGFEGSQDHDLLFRVLLHTQPERIIHIPRILYHWRVFRGSGSVSDTDLRQAIDARQRAAREYLTQKYPERRFRLTKASNGCNRIHYGLPDPAPLVSIIIPTRDGLDLLRACLSSLLDKTNYPAFEILIVDNESQHTETHAYFQQIQQLENVSVLSYPGAFNYSAINNFAVSKAKGSVVALLNNDIEVIEASWLTEMVSNAVRPEIGAVGAKLLFTDGSVQHAGVLLGGPAIANHAFQGYAHYHEGYQSRLQLPQYYQAVTGACLVVEKHKYLSVGGMEDEVLKVAFNDIDFCLRLAEQGYHTLYTPYAVLHHHESMTRGAGGSGTRNRLRQESAYLKRRWPSAIEKDKYYNRHFSNENGKFVYAGDFKSPQKPTD
ncbi:glycosyltransferase family 2 protein [Cohaesibacter intestini]|uniref:glycosyltransferase family 2 protein n=1 Tax=Cohaesibacter intestini TaxID=2211145 RepID=UPI000DEBDBC6|nr:glycosyltransferase family 2 protein [Cohaesibacter intestini]